MSVTLETPQDEKDVGLKYVKNWKKLSKQLQNQFDKTVTISSSDRHPTVACILRLDETS